MQVVQHARRQAEEPARAAAGRELGLEAGGVAGIVHDVREEAGRRGGLQDGEDRRRRQEGGELGCHRPEGEQQAGVVGGDRDTGFGGEGEELVDVVLAFDVWGCGGGEDEERS